MRRSAIECLCVAALAVCTFSLRSLAQGASPPSSTAYVPTMTFDVASIHETKPDADRGFIVGGGFTPQNSTLLRMTNVPMVWLLERGYGLDEYQIVGMPDWVYNNATIYNIEAKSDSSVDEKLSKLNKDQLKLEHQHMLQTLLAERLNFKAHWETRQGQVLRLVAEKGSKLRQSTGGPPSTEDVKFWGDNPIPPVYQRGDGGLGYELVGHACSIEDLAGMLEAFMDMTVVDTTGLPGRYDFDMKYSQARARERTPETWPPLRDALEDQLGLRFEDGTGPTRVLVVDHIDKPSAN